MNSALRHFEIDSNCIRGGVAVIYGGDSAEREISLRGGSAVAEALSRRLPELIVIDPGEQNPLQVIAEQNIAHVFLLLHGPGGEDGTIQGALEIAGVSYTGSGVLSSALAMDKLRCKYLWQTLDIPTPAFKQLSEDSDFNQLTELLGTEMIVKPAHEGSSIGMARVNDATALERAFKDAQKYDSDVMVESWLSGAEYTVAIVGDETLPAIRLETDRSFYDYDAKYELDTTRYYCPSGLADEKEQELLALAKRAYQSLDCRGWGRVDIMCDANDRFEVLEVNTCPGMTDHSLVPMAAAAAGIDFENLVARIFSESLKSEGMSC